MKTLTAAFALLATVAFSSSAFAATATGNAQVTILSAITLNEDQVVDFKSIPATDGVCTMAASGLLSGQCAGQPNGTPGQFTITGSASQAVAISVGSGSTSGGVTYKPILASTGTATGSATLDLAGNTVVNVIGDLTLLSATAGAKALTYVITVDYQ